MKYVLILQNGEVMDGVSFESLESAQTALEEYEAEYVAIDNDGVIEVVD